MTASCCDSSVRKAPYSPEELLLIATRYVNSHFHLPQEVRQDAIAEFVLAAHIALARSTLDRGVRSYQFLYGRGAAIRFVWEWERFGKQAPVSLDNLSDRAECAWIDDEGELREAESSPALQADTPTPLEILVWKEAVQTLRNITATLPDRCLHVVELHALGKWSFERIAGLINLPPDAIRRIYDETVSLL